MTRKDFIASTHPEFVDPECVGGVEGCPGEYPDLVRIDPAAKSLQEGYICAAGNDTVCGHCWNQEIPEETTSPHILDSGDRTQFESGAVRDMRAGKGRCDLMPLDVVTEYMRRGGQSSMVFYDIYNFQETDDIVHLYEALNEFCDMDAKWPNTTMLLETAIHFEDGARKYGDSNWRKGIPVKVFLDSALRHYIKFLRGDKDEPHDRAVCWNLMCAIWTAKHKPELDDYRKETVSDDGSVG